MEVYFLNKSYVDTVTASFSGFFIICLQSRHEMIDYVGLPVPCVSNFILIL
jgi:hypothetical protein